MARPFDQTFGDPGIELGAGDGGRVFVQAAQQQETCLSIFGSQDAGGGDVFTDALVAQEACNEDEDACAADRATLK